MFKKENNILVIESPGTLSILYSFIFRKRYTQIYYINNKFCIAFLKDKGILSWIKKIEYSDLEGSFFDVGEAGYNDGFDTYYNKNLINFYKNLAFRFCNSDLYEYALKKEIFNRYSEKRIKASIFINYLCLLQKKGELFFIPDDSDELILNYFLDPSFSPAYNTPYIFRFICKLSDIIKSIGCFLILPFILTYIVLILFLRGIFFSKKKETYDFGFDTYNDGINLKKPYHDFFIYDNNKFHHSKILHVVRNRFNKSSDAVSNIEFFKKNNMNYIEMDKIKIPFDYYLKVIIWDFYILSLVSMLKNILVKKNYRFCLPSIAIMKMKIEAEIFYSRYNVKLFIFRDEYSPFHIVRTIVAHSCGKKTFGFSHGDDCHHSGYLNCIISSKFALWGSFYKNYLKKSFPQSETVVIGAGIYGLDKTFKWMKRGFIPEKYREIVKKWRIVMIFASSFSSDLYITKELTIKFYKDVLNFTDCYKDIIRVIKPKGSEFEDSEFKELLKNYERVILEDSLWVYKALIVADVVICINVSTVGIEALMAGKKVLYYDVTGNKYHAYAKYSDYLVAYDPITLKRNIDRVFSENKYIDDEIIEEIKKEHGYVFDGDVTNRMKEICVEMLKE